MILPKPRGVVTIGVTSRRTIGVSVSVVAFASLFFGGFCFVRPSQAFVANPNGNIVSASSRGRTTTATTTDRTTRVRLLMGGGAGGGGATTTFLDTVSNAASKTLGRNVRLEPTTGGGAAGGGGATTGAVLDKETNTRYFIKSARNGYAMLRGEYEGVKAMSETLASSTSTLRVPTPIAFGEHESTGQAFALFEYLEFCGGGSNGQYELGVALAKMHQSGTSPNRDTTPFGFHVDNTIGATFQPNLPWHRDWADFWDQHRLGHMLKLTGNAGGLSPDKVAALRKKTRELLSPESRGGDPVLASIVHGDLWGGNKGFCKDNNTDGIAPAIFDPASYYGDREVDVAMTYVFGGFSGDFYDGYNSVWPLSEGHEKRRTVYNLYHILNHDVLFGGSYIRQAQGMIDQILRY
uniref:protein-ribulosamine 3-kinase n=1 Tax=Pseudo-nitzschia australis TaxID=44445 RepID=A0A7S4AXP1_9STRA|mmetsp:Transcript_13735/g.28809  ORF Transcript_13735/g.28809 Transcript_13735/m.28809 type:complete len:407 (-) Transcript_13735:63-1283(-)